jgi:hypothetical protein
VSWRSRARLPVGLEKPVVERIPELATPAPSRTLEFRRTTATSERVEAAARSATTTVDTPPASLVRLVPRAGDAHVGGDAAVS